MDEREVRFQFGPPIRAIFLAGIRYTQAAILVSAFGAAVLFLRFVQGQIGLAAALFCVVLGVAGAFGTVEGRPADDWLPVVARWLMTVMLGNRRWTSPTPSLGERALVPVLIDLDSAMSHIGAITRAQGNSSGPPNHDSNINTAAENGDPDLGVGITPPAAEPPKSSKRRKRRRLFRRKRAEADSSPSGEANGPTTRVKGPKRTKTTKRSLRRQPSEVSVDIRKVGKPSPPPPVAAWQLVHATISGNRMGVLRERRTKTWVAAISVEGQSFMLLDDAEKARRMSSWAAIQASMARHGSPVSRIQWMERTLTEVGDKMRAWFEDQAAATVGTAANDSYGKLLASAQPVTQQHETFLVLQVSGSRAGRAIKKAGGGDKGAIAVLYRELAHLQRQLRESDLRPTGFLSGDDLASLLRTQFDPEGVVALTGRQTDKEAWPVSARNAWPLATEVSWGHYRTDNTFHITYWVAEWPKLGVKPSFLAPLLLSTNGVGRTISVVAEPVPTAEAIRNVEHEQTARLSDDEIRTGAGYRTGARRRREAEALDRRENELADGHAEFRYSGYITVSGSDLDQLEAAAAALEQAAYQCPVELRRLWGEQESGFYTTMPLTLGLS